MKKLIKRIYNIIPFKQEIFSALKFFWKPKEGIFKHLHFNGIITVNVSETKCFKINHHGFHIENEIFWVGLKSCWEKESMKLWINLCKESNTIIDIGANTGIYSLVAKTINPNAKVYSFEPQPLLYTYLHQNIILNNFDIVPIKKAASNKDGIDIIDDFVSGFSLPVETLCLKTFIEQNKLEKLDLIKIDVETHEPEVLEGFSEYLFRFKPTLLIEILNNHIAEKVYNSVKNLDYLYFNIDEKGTVRQTEKIEKSDYYNYLLCNSAIATKIGLIKKS
jgi:FkbM family methyltransferase